MNPYLEIILNGEVVIKYPQNTRLPGKQREFLDIMDIDMDAGIELNGYLINQPSIQQRSHYVAMQLIQALKTNNNGLITASCAYLTTRQPTLRKVRANEAKEEITLELEFD